MKNLNYKIAILLLFIIGTGFVPAFGSKSIKGLDATEFLELDPKRNAQYHNNLGNIFMTQGNYIAALREYEIAFNLEPNSAASGAYLYNISRCYILFKNYRLAKRAIEGAISKDSINMTYYETLVDCYIGLGTAKKEISKHIIDRANPYNRIIAGLIYYKLGQKTEAKIIFDEFINDYPNMIISDDIRLILNRI